LRAPLAILALFAALPVHAQPQTLTFLSTLDGTEQPYAIYVPPDFQPSHPYPLVISLHTEDTDHRLHLRQLLGFPMPRRIEPDILIACPYARGDMGYRGIAEQDVYDMLAAIEHRFPVDPDRVSITGASMGGGGALWMALTRPDIWSAVAPISAAVIPGSDRLAPNLLHVPVRFYHGDQDPVVPVSCARDWQRRLLDAGVNASYIEYPDVRHNAWSLAYHDGAVLSWLTSFRRDRAPQHVHFVTDSYRYSGAYWVNIDGLTPGTLATIDARRTAPHSVTVETQNLEGFSLTLDRPAASVTIDGATLHLRPASTLSFHKSAGHWHLGRYRNAGKRPGAEGPIVEAVDGNPLYVYGSLDVHTAEALDVRRAAAERAAHWESPRSRLDFAPEVKVDTAVTPHDLDTHDLVLLGDSRTNSLIAQFAGSLPLALAPGAADYGLLYLVPHGKHYFLVSSGLPWWTGARAANRGGYLFAPDQYALLSTFGDYVLFKGGLEHVLAEGRFDTSWKVPADAARRFAASGVVTVQ
jgi:pimeloyl-ACP methyl ester carboxylesterase